MQTYRVDVLDEKALTLLRGLEELRVIVLRPWEKAASGHDKESEAYQSSEIASAAVEEPAQLGWKAMYGSVPTPSKEDVENYLQEISKEWE
ncbi:MAG: hypothetical protein WBA17_13645 [Saprospiraceae bacterium]